MIAVGEVAGAGLLAHVPTIMLPHDQRLELNEGKEISLVTGLQRLRAEVFETLDYDTVVVLDSHWHTTVEFVVAAQPVRAGLFTSDELPRGMCRIPYDWRGHPELAQAMLLAILHYIPDLAEARRILARLVDAVPSGSYLTISHAASDISPEAMAEMIRRMNEHLAEGNHVGRTREVVASFFDGLDLLDPGVVKVTEWRPESAVEAEGPTSLWGGVARKP